MKFKSQRTKGLLYLTIILVILQLNIFLPNLYKEDNSYVHDNSSDEDNIFQIKDLNTQGTVEDEFTKEWLKNGDFASGIEPWFNTTEGDVSDVNATYSQEAANYEILGEEHMYALINGTPSTAKGWSKSQNLQYPAEPNQAAEFRAGGAYARHRWSESEDQQVIAQWDKTIDTGRNMSDYIVTGASLNITVNATVHSNPGYDGGNNWGGLDVSASESQGGSQFNVGDFIRYFITISDIDKNKIYPEVLSYQTSGLGADHGSGNQYDYLYDTVIEVDDENDLIFILNNLFQNYNDQYLNITIGMFFNCEDNWSSDDDFFEDIYITSVNFTFTYKKKIDRDTTLSWNQVGNKISGNNVDIVSAVLNFNYTIDKSWPSDSPNAEVRVIINGTQFSQTIKLSTATTDPQEAKVGGFDVGYLIKKDVNISLSLQVFLADEFELNQTITFSIDDVSLNITYSVSTVESPTELNIYLNGIDKSLDKSIEIPWRETVNITVTYRNSTLPKNPILGATVHINGTDISEQLNPIGSNYSVIINSTKLAFGNNYLSLHAEEKYYESIDETIKITVVDRPTFIDNVFLNYTEQTYINMQYNEILNISVSYNDSLTNNFITGATVSINGTDISEPMPENSQNQYSVEINTTDLELGLNFLTISAQKDNYSLATKPITIAVNIKDTYLDVAFNGTFTTEFGYYNISIGELLNITAWYREVGSNAFIAGATVDLIESSGSQSMPSHPEYDQYNITISATDLDVGVKFLTISAQKENYTSRSKTVPVIVSERATVMELWLNGTKKTTNPTIELNVNETLNITTTYRDVETSEHLSEADGAGIRIFGSGIDDNFTEYFSQEQYTYFLNTSELSQGVNFLNILAERDGYESQYILLTIIITERNTSIELFLNGTDFTHFSSVLYNLTIGDFLNITVRYKDWITKNHIDLALVEVEGEGISKQLTEYATLGQYSIILDSEDLNRGINFLTITAYKSNYQPRQKQLKINIADKASILNLYINGVNRTSDTFFNFYWNEPLNITVFYLENGTKQLINDATVELRDLEGGILLYDLPKNDNFDQYNRTINTADLGIGIKSLLIIASKENYETSTKSIILTISERIAEFQLFINGTQMSYNGNKEVEVTDILNITVFYRDNITKQNILTADIELYSIDNFTVSSYNFYNLTLNVGDVQQEGVAILTVIAENSNYKTYTFVFRLSIIQVKTNLDIFFNGVNVTASPTITFPIGTQLNLTVKYTDRNANHIPGANVSLSTDFIANLTEQISYKHYIIVFNTILLKIGTNTISLKATKYNHQEQVINLYIDVRKIRTKVDTEDGDDTITIRPGEDAKITIEIKDLDFGGGIEDAEVTYDWKLGDGDLDDEGDGIYEVTLEDVPEGTYTITISVYKEGGRYEFEDYEITLVVKRSAEENLLFQILLIAAIIVGFGMAGYIVAYQKYLKYPKAVRKVRKYRRTLKKRRAPSVDIISREKAFNELYSDELGKTSKLMKSKPKEEIIPSDKIIKKKTLKSPKNKTSEELSEKVPQKSVENSKK